MDDIVFMQVLKGLNDLSHEVPHLDFTESLVPLFGSLFLSELASPLDQILEWVSVAQLHENVNVFLILKKVLEVDDVFMF